MVKARDLSIKKENEKKCLKEVVSTKNGRSFLWTVLEIANVFHSSFSNEPLNMAFLEGKREIGLKIFKMIEELEPGLVYKIAKENMEENANDN